MLQAKSVLQKVVKRFQLKTFFERTTHQTEKIWMD